jgi:hypothetical protein
MDDLWKVIRQSSEMMYAREFGQAEKLLNDRLGESRSKEDQFFLLQQLQFVRVAAGNLPKAQRAMDAREAMDPSGATALSNAYFHLYSKGETQTTQSWVLVAIQRANAERDTATLYSAHSLAGLLAARVGDSLKAKEALSALRQLLASEGEISWGDAVTFLESIRTGVPGLNDAAMDLAGRIASKIEDVEFRSRAEAVANGL